MELIVISGMSGAGKSTALRAMEDLGYYCVDNMPPMLLGTFYDLCQNSKNEKMKKCAVGIDIRSTDTFEDLYKEIRPITQQGKKFKILFLDAKIETLITRYKETRRTHPLADMAENRSVERAVELERHCLESIKLHADYSIDTTLMSMKQLKERVFNLFSENPTGTMKVVCMSFGFKYGIPLEADVIFDARCLPNPYYVPQLKNLTGMDKVVRDYVMKEEISKEFLNKILNLLDFSLPLYKKEGKSELVIAIGCTGGKHRSVTIASHINYHLHDLGYPTTISHRDITKQ